MLELAAAILFSTSDVANGLRNLAQMHAIAGLIEMQSETARTVPANVPNDPWGTPYRFEGERIVSAGSDKKFEDSPAPGQFAGTEGDVVFEDGALVRSNRNWLYARVEQGKDSAVALNELRDAEKSMMLMRTPLVMDLMRVQLTIQAIQHGPVRADAWGTPLRVDGTRLISAGADRQFDPMSWDRKAANDVREDIILDNGVLVRAVDPQALFDEKPPHMTAIRQPVDESYPDGPKYRRVREGITAPVVVKRAEPRYFEDYRRMRISGIVIVEALISEKGVVEDVRLLKSVAPELDVAAMDSVRQWTFEPATMDGKPIPVIFHLAINFKLE